MLTWVFLPWGVGWGQGRGSFNLGRMSSDSLSDCMVGPVPSPHHQSLLLLLPSSWKRVVARSHLWTMLKVRSLRDGGQGGGDSKEY